MRRINALFRQGQLVYPPMEEGANDPSRPLLKPSAGPVWAATAIVLVAFVALLVAGGDGVVNTVRS